jgi:hypothetical protein
MYVFQGPELTGRIVYADESYQMNEAGEERVGFTSDEWAIMMKDPRFGYVCRQGHLMDQTFAAYEGGCRTCFNLAEDDYDYDEEDAKALAPRTLPPAVVDFSPDDAPF